MNKTHVLIKILGSTMTHYNMGHGNLNAMEVWVITKREYNKEIKHGGDITNVNLV